MKNILITGATGFVGHQVLSNLMKTKKKIYVITRNENDRFLRDNKSKIELIYTDDLFRQNADWWAVQCRGIDTVVHIAWYAEPGKYLESIKNIDCLIGSLNLTKGAIRAGIRRFVGIGTCLEYDLNYGDLSVNTPLKPTTPYATAKVGLYNILSQCLPSVSIEFSWCRLFYLYGEGEDKRRLFPYLHNRLSKGEYVELTSGDQIRDYLDVSVAGKAITEVALGKQQGPINICSGKPITIKKFAEQIADIYNGRNLLRFGHRPDNSQDPPRIVGIPNL